MRTSLSIVLLTSAVALAACDAEPAGDPTRRSVARGGEPPTEVRPACVQRHAKICGLAPPRRRVQEGVAYKLTTVAGESFWLVLPGTPLAGVVAVPRVPISVNVELTTASPRAAADRYCAGFTECAVTVVDRVAVPSGVMTRWDDASGSIRDLNVTTVDIGRWTLVLLEPDARRAERVARALRWRVDEDGYPRVVTTDRRVSVDVDWAGVSVWVTARDDDFLIEIVPGCELSSKEPDLGGLDAGPALELHAGETVAGGRWCAAGRYAVDVSFVDGRRLELLRENLRIVTASS